MADEVKEVKVDKTFRACPVSGCQDGYHSMSERGEGGDGYSRFFIGPSCHSTFGIGLKVPA